MRILSGRVEYLAAVLPTTPMNDKSLSAKIFDMMKVESRTGQSSFQRSIQIVEGFESYLKKQSTDFSANPGFAGRPKSGSGYILSKVQDALTFGRKESAKVTGQPDLLDL
jgi:hypothetical protein